MDIAQFKERIKQLIEQAGIYIFFISIMLSTQIRWVKKHNKFDEIEIRLFLGFFAGTILSFVVILLIKRIYQRINKDYETFLTNLSIALSPGILFILGATNKTFRTAAIISCVVLALYIWVKPFKDFVDSLVYTERFKGILTIKDNKAVIDIRGVYEKANPKAMHIFLSDLIINLYECFEMKVDEVKIVLSNLEERNEEELKSIIQPLGKYFNLKIIFE